jgi:hypothetical protein
MRWGGDAVELGDAGVNGQPHLLLLLLLLPLPLVLLLESQKENLQILLRFCAIIVSSAIEQDWAAQERSAVVRWL